ncbi:aldolase [Methylocella sp. CPCC 101449]|jgi:serine kinase of HPr protein (carbohydrate metabolism regulator)|uniref:HPr kinase/phosphorylase n=1 Tax=Methylocella sp. CPCC 101449 TaxID=2987531 RepID=UPI0028927674|nr:aldolase [Methylocella sp. CPCC 101449]MDT2019194.1 aldolase [Methylocella sp. CPCC 101449]HEV2573407.1 aldolase [Beijerinckiaceae bacterium]
MSGAAPAYHHATAVIVGERAVVIRGESGSGKSTLAHMLLDQGALAGLFVRLVGDDRVALAAAGGRLVVRGHPAIAGLVEQRGEGLHAVAAEPAAVVTAVVDLCTAKPARIPSETELVTDICGVRVPRLALLSHSFGPETASQVISFVQRQNVRGANKNG